jgi:hypothetical protein
MSPEFARAPGALLPARLHGPLVARGFACTAGTYRADDLTFAADGRWWVLRENRNEPHARVPGGDLGQPGLWKSVASATPPARVFELPVWSVNDRRDESRFDEDGTTAFADVLDWALATRRGVLPSGWQAPAADLVHSWLAEGALTISAKGRVSQCDLLCRANRWALRLPIVPRLDPDLPVARHRALASLAEESQRRWAMVRVGLTAAADPAAIVAEVDFTGAPHSELLFSAGVDVLRHLFAWLAETAAVLADRSVEIVSLARGGPRNTEERKHTP